jgi:hypothetical protein
MITIDGRRESKVINAGDIEKTGKVLKSFAVHPICDSDRPKDGSDGNPSKVNKLLKKFESEIRKRKTSQ